MAHTSMLLDLVEDEALKEELLTILDMQMATSAILATDFEELPEGIPKVGQEHISFLEAQIDYMDSQLEPLVSFVIPGGDPAVSQAHIARTVCRRTERNILKLLEEMRGEDELILQFYNRLSDYFFVLSRKIAALKGIKQRPWNRGL